MAANSETIPTAKREANYADAIARQESLLMDLREKQQKQPSSELNLEIRRTTDTLRHLQHLAKGGPKDRARTAANAAKSAVLARVIAQP